MFETISHPATARRVDPRILPAAISLHAAVAVAALVASTWQIPEVAAPDLTEAYVMVTLPPLPDPAPAPREPERRAPEPQQQEAAQAPVPPPIQQPDPEQATTPSTNPDDSDATDLSDLTPVTDPGSGGGPPDGPPGPGGGNGDCIENCGPGDGEGDIAYPTPGMSAPRVIERVMPVYPELAKRVRKTGRVIVKAVIDASGRVRDAEVLNRHLGFGLEESALKAVYQWRFEPARLGDRPMAVYFNLTVDFSLQ